MAITDQQDQPANVLLDQLSLRIIEELIRTPTLPYKEIGKLVDCDQRTVSRRISELQKAGIIKVTVEIDWRALGLGASAYVGLSTARTPKASDLLHDYITNDQRIVEAYETLGGNQFFIKVLEGDAYKIRDTVLRDLDPLAADLSTSLVTRVLKPRDYFSLVRRIREERFPRSRSLSR